jgi:outer membrane immunogenic protein
LHYIGWAKALPIGSQVWFRNLGAAVKHLAIALLAATGLSVGVSQIASAADLPVKAPIDKAPVAIPFSWTGFYIGGSAGYGWGRSGDVNPITSVNYLTAPSAAVIATTGAMAAAVPGSLPISPRGFIAGGAFGYNYQVSRVVWGIEADFSAANIQGSQSGGATASIPGFAPDTVTSTAAASQKLDFLGTVRGRLGITPIDSLLVYGTGGLAYGHVSSSTTVSEIEQPPGTNVSITTANGSTSAIRAGWVLGAGLEWAWSSHWSVKGEYLHYDLGTLNYSAGSVVGTAGFPTGTFGAANIVSSTQFKGDIARLGINYRF